MYSDDSFHTLSTVGQIGLIALSSALAIGLLVLAWLYMLDRTIAVRLAIALALLYLFVWLSPQVYYTYYLNLFDIPWQNVIKTPPGPQQIAKLLAFQNAGSLSDHSKGVLGWALIALALLRPHRGRSA